MEKIQTSFYSPEELKEIGFKSVGENVLIRFNFDFFNFKQWQGL